MLIKSLPNTMIVHLKRFKYDEQMKRLVKLQYKVAFPSDIRVEAVISFHYSSIFTTYRIRNQAPTNTTISML